MNQNFRLLEFLASQSYNMEVEGSKRTCIEKPRKVQTAECQEEERRIFLLQGLVTKESNQN